MAGSFPSPSGAAPKMKVGKVNRPKRSASAGPVLPSKPEYPITDDFASREIPSFATRRHNTNNKSGWNTKPGKPQGGRRLAEKVSSPERGRGIEMRSQRS